MGGFSIKISTACKNDRANYNKQTDSCCTFVIVCRNLEKFRRNKIL